MSEKMFALHHLLMPKSCILEALWKEMSMIKKQLQPFTLSNLLWFSRTRAVTRRYHSYCLWYLLVSEMCVLKVAYYSTTSITAIGFCYVIISRMIIWREHLKPSICQGHCVYFKTLVSTIHYLTSGLWLNRNSLNGICIWWELL